MKTKIVHASLLKISPILAQSTDLQSGLSSALNVIMLITVNVDPLPVRKEIAKEEKEHDRIAGDYASEKKLSLLTVMEKKQRKIHALTSGHTLPFHVYFAVRTWDKTKEGLCAKTNAIKNAINAMNSAQYYESTLPSTSKNLFFQTWPGWTWGKYEARKLYGETRYIADMLPFSSTFTGHLETAEAIYEGAAHNLIGIKTFSGEAGNSSPQHAVLIGMSGTGKSVTVCDLLTQTEGYFAYTVIIEKGLSYGIYTQTVDPNAKPIIIQPDGDITINYLDTKGLPLTPDHLSAATALVARMAGVSQQEDKQMLRQALIAKFINLLYEDVYSDWSNKNSHQIMGIARHALATARYRREKMPAGATMLEAFADFRDWMDSRDDEALDFFTKPDDGEVLKFLKDPNTAKEVRNVAFSYFKPYEFPTHRMLQELMYLDAGGAEKEQVVEIATLLLPWCREGNYGCLFDGESNLSLTGKIAHFELGYIPDSAKELKTAAGFLITNDARKHIMTLPRAARKRNVYEEVARFLDIPGGEEIVKESYAQLRKFNCWNISIVQQYARFKQSRIRSAVFGNSRQFYLMRQNDRADLDDIAVLSPEQAESVRYAESVKAYVRKGEKACRVVFWKLREIKDEQTGEADKIPLLRFYYVFNVAQCDGLKNVPTAETPADAPAKPEIIVATMPQRPEIKHGMALACYSPSVDIVSMPNRERFGKPEEYYGTLFHELIHSTGHPTRLNRSTLCKSDCQ